MISSIFASRAGKLVAAILTVGLLAGFGVQHWPGRTEMRAYCAQLPDSIGLFPGSAVTVRGVPVGEVTGIKPDGRSARVDFEIRADRRLPADVGATTLAQSLIADRRLALVGAVPETGESSWDAGDCITRTVTPKSITLTLAAVSSLADELNGGAAGISTDEVAEGLEVLGDATTGTGEEINSILLALGRALDSPDAAIGHIGSLIDALSQLSTSIDNGWGDIKSMLTRLPPTLVAVDKQLMSPAVEIIRRLRDVLPMINDISLMFGGEILDAIEGSGNLPQRIAAGVGSLDDMIDLIPVFAAAFERATDPSTGAISFGYRAASPALPADVAERLCDQIGLGDMGLCRGEAALAGRLPALLGSAGTR